MKILRLFRQNTIFNQLIVNVLLLIIFALIALEVITYFHTKKILVDATRDKNRIVFDEIKQMLDFQDLALNILDGRLEPRLQENSNNIINKLIPLNDSAELIDLVKIREKIGLSEKLADLYLINRNGIVVNTTFEDDYNRNFFDFGNDHKQFLLGILRDKKFVSERFTIESSTKRLKKYTYQPTLDGKYILEIGVYAPEADSIINHIIRRINSLSSKHTSTISVDLFIGHEKPFSLNNKNATIKAAHLGLLPQRFSGNRELQFNEYDPALDKNLQYYYSYMDRRNTALYRSSVIRIVSDSDKEQAFLNRELIKNLILFVITLLVITVVLYYRIQSITFPIRKLIGSVSNLAKSKTFERVEVVGNNELTEVSMQYNVLITTIEGKNEEIQSLNATIEKLSKGNIDASNQIRQLSNKLKLNDLRNSSNLEGVQKIQRSLMPHSGLMEHVFGESFIFFQPRHIVGGDLYWFSKIPVGKNTDDTKKSKAIMVVADCSGQGIPGALVSALGLTLIKQLVERENITQPSELLQQLDKQITQLLNSTETNTFYEGMDIAVCLLDFEANKLHFAGAMMPIIILRNQQIINLDGSQYPVGKFYDERVKTFSTRTFDFAKGDSVYMFTNGYADQISDTDKSKFMMRRFERMLVEVSPYNMQRQGILVEKNIVNWMGNEQQNDDMLVVGIRI